MEIRNVGFFCWERSKTREPSEKKKKRNENQQQTQPTFGVNSLFPSTHEGKTGSQCITVPLFEQWNRFI